MADIYTPPRDSAYLLSTGFLMPGENGDKWAMAFNSRTGTILTAGLSVVITVMFLSLWNLISFIGMCFDGKKTRRRYAALVTLWNSNDPWFACKELLSYAFECLKSPKPKSKDDFWYGLLLGVLALLVFFGGMVASIMVPSALLIGNVAPVRPSSVFYPQLPDEDVRALQRYGLLAPAAMRSLGSVEAAEVTLRDRVIVDEDPKHAGANDAEPIKGIKYNYSLSGVDMGLRWGSQLSLEVTGSCITEYGWLDKKLSNDPKTQADVYHLWNNKSSEPQYVPLVKAITLDAPSVGFFSHPNGADQLMKDSNVSYAVVIYSAHRSSISKGGDPWYATENRDEPAGEYQYNADYWMKRFRPVLSCWQQDKWRYGSDSVKSVKDLKAVPGIKIKEVLLDVLETAFGDSPMIVKLASASGDAALRSRTTSPNGVIDAESCSMYDDMERLILASFVASRSIFTDATMFPETTYRSVIRGPDGKPRSGAGDFVVSSPEIQTFSLGGVTALLTLLVVLILANAIASRLLLFFEKDPKTAKEDSVVEIGDGGGRDTVDRWTRFRVLTAVNLFRCLYEDDTVDVKLCYYSCDQTKAGTETVDEMRLVGGCRKGHCSGHTRKRVTGQSDDGQSDDGHKGKSHVQNTRITESVDEKAQENDPMLPSALK
ncbi:hypothetical protein ACHAPT_003980 [Fusarium lateritium]